jgi:hypothetical protein
MGAGAEYELNVLLEPFIVDSLIRLVERGERNGEDPSELRHDVHSPLSAIDGLMA